MKNTRMFVVGLAIALVALLVVGLVVTGAWWWRSSLGLSNGVYGMVGYGDYDSGAYATCYGPGYGMMEHWGYGSAEPGSGYNSGYGMMGSW